jgi:Skp family chaperone for outer membrane proteins
MNRMFLALVVMTATLSSAAAQGKDEKLPPAGATRVAVVNFGLVFRKYYKLNRSHVGMPAGMIPLRDKARVLVDQTKAWHDEMMKEDFDPAQKERFEAGIRRNKLELEQMQEEVKKILAKGQEENLVALWKEVQEVVGTIAKERGIQLVLGYGDPIEKELLYSFPNVDRKKQAMDTGNVVPLFVADGVDISEEVVALLNRRYQEKTMGDPSGNKK